MYTPSLPHAGTHLRTRLEGLVDARSDGQHGGEIAGGARTLVRLLAGAYHVADQVIPLRHDEAAEFLAGLLVPDTAVVVLHGEHPIEIPLDLVEDIRRAIAGFGDVQAEVLHVVGPNIS